MTQSEFREIREHMIATYFRLRITMALLALFFPFVLALIGIYVYAIPLADNMSSYFYSSVKGYAFPMRVWFVGFLWAIGFCLVIYKGFTTTEFRVLVLAGLCAVGVAIVPTEPPCVACGPAGTLWPHRILGAGFFACAAYVASFCSDTTLKYFQEEQALQKWIYMRVYDLLSFIMVGAALAGLALVYIWGGEHGPSVFVIEAIGFCTFAIFWLVKTVELSTWRVGNVRLGNSLEHDLINKGNTETMSADERDALNKRLARLAEPVSAAARKSWRRRLSRALERRDAAA